MRKATTMALNRRLFRPCPTTLMIVSHLQTPRPQCSQACSPSVFGSGWDGRPHLKGRPGERVSWRPSGRHPGRTGGDCRCLRWLNFPGNPGWRVGSVGDWRALQVICEDCWNFSCSPHTDPLTENFYHENNHTSKGY